jgi:hypothetical protein
VLVTDYEREFDPEPTFTLPSTVGSVVGAPLRTIAGAVLGVLTVGRVSGRPSLTDGPRPARRLRRQRRHRSGTEKCAQRTCTRHAQAAAVSVRITERPGGGTHLHWTALARRRLRRHSMQGMANKKRWSDLTGRQRAVILVAASVELALTSTALVDIIRRPAAQVRGPKALWVVGFVIQPVGPIAYLVRGRRPPNR